MNIEHAKTQLRAYADLKAQISVLENQLEILKPEVETIVVELAPEDKVVETEFGTFTMVPKRKYTYSEAVQLAEKALKDTKKNEEATGVATYEVNPYVLFKPTVL